MTLGEGANRVDALADGCVLLVLIIDDVAMMS